MGPPHGVQCKTSKPQRLRPTCSERHPCYRPGPLLMSMRQLGGTAMFVEPLVRHNVGTASGGTQQHENLCASEAWPACGICIDLRDRPKHLAIKSHVIGCCGPPRPRTQKRPPLPLKLANTIQKRELEGRGRNLLPFLGFQSKREVNSVGSCHNEAPEIRVIKAQRRNSLPRAEAEELAVISNLHHCLVAFSSHRATCHARSQLPQPKSCEGIRAISSDYPRWWHSASLHLRECPAPLHKVALPIPKHPSIRRPRAIGNTSQF